MLIVGGTTAAALAGRMLRVMDMGMAPAATAVSMARNAPF